MAATDWQNGEFAVDSTPLVPQPTSHEWDDDVLASDGDGAPIKKKYRTCRLIFDRPIGLGGTAGRVNWFDFDDGSTHTVELPLPDKSDHWKEYATVYIVASSGGVVAGKATDRLEIVISKIDAS